LGPFLFTIKGIFTINSMNISDRSKFPLVVIVGGGFGGVEVANRLADKPVEVLMLDKHNYHTFQPLLYQVALGSLESESIAFSIRKTTADKKTSVSG
jgi:NADH dehydrogenase